MGMRGVRETFLPVLFASASFTLTQYFTSAFIGPELPDITSAIVSITVTTTFLKFYKVKKCI